MSETATSFFGAPGTEAKQSRIYPEANPQPQWGPITRRLIVRKLARHRVRSTHALGGTRDLDLLPLRDEDDSTNILLSGPLGPALAQSYPEQFCCPRLGSWDLPGMLALEGDGFFKESRGAQGLADKAFLTPSATEGDPTSCCPSLH